MQPIFMWRVAILQMIIETLLCTLVENYRAEFFLLGFKNTAVSYAMVCCNMLP